MTRESAKDWRVRWRLFSGVIGTAALVCGGLSIVIVMSGDGSPMGRLVPNEQVQMALTGEAVTTFALIEALDPDDIVLGGGNVARLKNLPPGCRAGSNDNAFLGGFRLW